MQPGIITAMLILYDSFVFFTCREYIIRGNVRDADGGKDAERKTSEKYHYRSRSDMRRHRRGGAGVRIGRVSCQMRNDCEGRSC